MSSLEKCRACNSSAQLIVNTENMKYYVQCANNDCLNRGFDYWTKETAIIMWNGKRDNNNQLQDGKR